MSRGHDHAGAHELGRAFAIGLTLNAGFVIAEVAFGLAARSTALLADAAHNLSDVLGLALAWGATVLARRPPSPRLTYGLRRSTVLAALANVGLVLAAVGGIAWESIGRLRAPSAPEASTMIGVAAAGVLVNGASALLFRRARQDDANVRGAFLHLLADAAVSAGVVVAGVLVWRTGIRWIDPVTSLAISVVVLLGTWRLLRDALHLAMDGVPWSIELLEVRAFLRDLPGVEDVHDLHVWGMSTTDVALTAHLVMPWTSSPPAFLGTLDRELEERFGVAHVTIQIDPARGAPCARTAPRRGHFDCV